MEQLVVTRETAKKLKEAGFPQECLHQWAAPWPEHLAPDGTVFDGWGVINYDFQEDLWDWRGYAAPTAQEIADQLPICLDVAKNSRSSYTAWIADYDKLNEPQAFGPSMAEAMANLYLKLHEDRLLSEASS